MSETARNSGSVAPLAVEVEFARALRRKYPSRGVFLTLGIVIGLAARPLLGGTGLRGVISMRPAAAAAVEDLQSTPAHAAALNDAPVVVPAPVRLPRVVAPSPAAPAAAPETIIAAEALPIASNKPASRVKHGQVRSKKAAGHLAPAMAADVQADNTAPEAPAPAAAAGPVEDQAAVELSTSLK